MQQPDSPTKFSKADSLVSRKEDENADNSGAQDNEELRMNQHSESKVDEKGLDSPSQENSPKHRSMKKASVEPQVIDWIRQKVQSSINMFDDAKHWTKPLQEEIKKLCLLENVGTKLFIWIENDQVVFASDMPHEIQKDTALVFNFGKEPVTIFDIDKKILVRKIQKNHLKSLVSFMNGIFIPSIMGEKSWPDNVKKEFLGQLHKFMTSITETCFQLEGYTELYIPKQDLSNTDGQDKDLIQRLQTTIIQWNRQIKQIVSNPDSHQENENSGPLDEIQYWRNRRQNLKHIDEQLQNAQLKAIVRFLQKMDSNDARGFGQLAENIKSKSQQAQNNLLFLESLFQPCRQLEVAQPKQIPQLIPELLKRVRMIWHHSKFYNSNDRITNLLNKISNQIIQRCKAKINVDDMLDGDVEKCIQDLNDAIECGKRWREIYDKFQDVINTTQSRKWSFVTNSIFASVQAFVQRCSELIQICQGQLQFALKGRDNQLPRFGGARASEIVGILQQIKGSFVKLIDKFKANKKDKILDVKASNWHEEYNTFKSGVKELDVMYQNVIDFAFKQVTTIEQGVNMLEAFDYLAKRDSIKTCVKKKAIEVMNLFISEIESAKQQIENKKDPNTPLHHGKFSGGAILIRSVIFRLEKFKDKIDKLYFIQDQIKSTAIEKYLITVKQLESLIKDQKLAVWKQQNKYLEQSGNLSKTIEAVTILCRPDQNHEDYKLPLEILRPKPHHIQCNFDRKLLKLINEVSAWKVLIPFNIRIPNEPDEFVMSNRQNLRVLRQFSMVVVREYNQIIDFMDDNQRNLFAEHLQATDKIIQPGITRFKWSSKSNVDSFLGRTCRGVCSDLYHKLKQFKANTEKIQQKCQEISSKMFLKINKKKYYQIDEFYEEQKVHREEIKQKLQIILNQISDILCHSYELFANGRKETQLYWFNYIKEVDRKIEEALKKGIKNSLIEFYIVIGDPEKNITPTPIFIISVILERDDPPKLAYKPTTNYLIETINSKIISSINDVVSGFGKVQNKMYQVYKKKRDEMLVRMEKEKNPNRKTVEEEEIKPHEGYQYYKISDDQDILKYSSKILLNLNKVCNQVTRDSTKDKWANSLLFWENKRKEKFIKNVIDYNWMDISQLREQIQMTNGHSQEIQQIKSSHPIGCIILDDSRFKTTLSEIVILMQNMFMSYLQQRCIDELKSLHDLFITSEANLTPEPQDLQQLKKNTDTWQELMNNREQFQKKLQPLRDKFAQLDANSIQLKQEENKLRFSLMDAWNHYNEMLLQIEKRNQRVRSVFEYQAKKNLTDFLDQAKKLKVDLQQNAPFQATYTNESAFNKLNQFHDIVKGLRAKWNDMIFGFDLFNISYNSPADLDHVDKEIKNLYNVWSLKEDWDQNYKIKVKDIKFKDINCQTLEQYADDYIYKLNGLTKQPHIKKWGISVFVKQSIENFKAVLPLIDFLRKPFMRPRHWVQLKNHIDFDPQSENFTFDEIFVQKNFIGHSQTINNTCEIARQEYKIESALDKIRKQWQNLDIQMEPHKKTWKIRGTDTIFATLQDNMGILSTQKTGLFYENFKDQIQTWENNLQKISETLEMLAQVQRQWIYLQAIFASQQDQDRQLIGDINKFQILNNRISAHMDRIHTKPNILSALLVDNFYNDLDDISKRLDESQKVLFSLLQTKRGAFPRFYFLANDDLFELLGNSRDPGKVNKHIKKCFEGIKKLSISSTPIPGKKADNFSFDVIEIISPEDQAVKLANKIPVQNGVQYWLKQVEKQMKQSLKKYLYATFSTYCKKKDPKAIGDWVENHHGQLLITASQIYWTSDCENILKSIMNSQKPDKGKAWKGLKQEKSFFLSQLTRQVRKTTKFVTRLKLIALITIEVHARDITDILSKTCFSINSFQWKKQLRFKANLQGESADCYVQQTNTNFPYGFEYQGNNGRLVVTALTDRCYMTLTTAMHLKKGGAPQGPAGTGKTQTVKDLGKGMAKFVLVFNCSEGLDYKSLGRMFSGLMQTGGWGCFDQFNRIQLEVLSVVAQQMLSILNALKALQKHGKNPQNPFSFVFQGVQIPADDQCAIFITMNPGYAGRSQLPDNLKSLFRPISMMVPESTMICQIMLSSEGFKYGKPISNKIVVLYQLMSQQLSKQDHYDFGLRAIKSVLTCAGAIRRDSNVESPIDKVDKKDKEAIKEMQEQELNQQILIVMKAIMDMNIPKFVAEDIPLFNSLFNDLFPNIEMQEINNDVFLGAVQAEMKKAGLVPKPQIIKKIVQLYDSKNTRHGNMLVGSSMSGKSTCWKMLKNTLNTLNKQNPKKYPQVKNQVLNPKSIDLKELFGFVDGNLQWHEGVLSSMMSRLCKQESQAQRWMVLDGPVDTLWIESMNTVLDDNKVLTLLNGDRISLPPQVGLVFQVQDLAVASPATVSRAGMVFLNLNDLGWRPYFQSWLALKVKEQSVQDAIKQLTEKWFARLFDKKKVMKDEFKEHVPSLQVSIIIAFTKLFDAFLLGDGKAADFNMQNKPDNYFSTLQKWFIFCMVWSFGGTLDEVGRKTFDSVMRDIQSIFPGNFTVFDYYINPDKSQWQSWDEKVNNTAWKPPATASYHSLLVPTVDSARTKYILQACVANKLHSLSVGVTGTGKTVLINQILGQLDESNWKINNIIFSSQTSSVKTQDTIEGKMVRRTKTKMVPDGKKMVIFVDDLNMPKKDTYGSQPPLQLIRQWMDYGGWFDRIQNQIFKKVEEIQFISSMGPPGGGRNQISRRIQTKFLMVNFTFPSEPQVRRIFQNILSHKFLTQDFDDQIKQISQTLAYATINLYNSIADNFLPTPAKSHYMFNMRDISKVIQGVYIFDKFYCDSKLTIFRLWVHESLRVFHDRLINDSDRLKFKKLISDQLEQTLQTTMKECTDPEQHDTIFVDFFDESQNRQIYIEVFQKQREQLKKIIEDKLLEFNEKFKSAAMNITLFQVAISYVCKINRVIKFSKGHAMLVGEGGAGRHSLTKLATFIAKYNLCQVTISKGFKLKQFRQKIKEWSQECAFKDNASAVFMFSDNQISEESFVEDINTILTIGEIPNLFGKQDYPTIKEKMKKVVARMLKESGKEGKDKQIKDEVLITEFYTRIQNNFHIVFLMSKTGDNLRNYGRMYPGLINNTTIIYFMPWPTQALFEVANNSLKHFDFDEVLRNNISEFFSNAHTKVIKLSEKMWKQLKRLYYVTPTNYIQLVKGYCQLLNNKREQIGSQIEKLSGGLGKLDEAQSNSNQLQKNLAIFNNQLGKKSKDCQQLMIRIDKETRQSKDKKNQLAQRENQVNKEKNEMQHLKADAQADLKKAEPALLAAELGLANLTKDKLSVVKSYSTPPGGVDVVLNAVMILLNKQPSWAVAKKELADTSFLQRLQNIDKGRVPISTLKRIEKLTQDPKMQISRIDSISEAAGGMWRWVLAVQGYAKAFKDIQPKKNKVNNLMEKLKKSEEELQTLRDNFSKVQQIINGLNNQLEKAKSDMDSYKIQTEQLQIKLERAEKLITGLASTKQGWKQRKEKLQQKYSYIIGDSLMTAAFLSYAGPFPSEYREVFLQQELLQKVRQFKISHSKDYNFPEFLVKPVDFIKWGLKGLPDDQFSKENGVLVRKGRMFPLMIDPQLQGNKWIREMQKQNKDKFIILDPQTDNYMKTIQMSVANGNVVLLQNLEQEIDSSLEPLLNKTIKKVADKLMIYLGDKDIRYNENFRLFMTTKLPNPKYKPQVTTKVILVNFTVKQKGLQEQLTSVVIQRMEMQLENSKNELIKNKSDNEQRMKKIDDGILKSLSSAKTNLIEDQNIIVYLQQSKQTQEKVRHQIQSSIAQMKKINLARQNYKKLAKIASKLFFIINDFALIESMYQFSLDAYIGLFQKTIKEYIQKPGLNDSLNEKLDAIADKLKTGIYRYACRGLFEKDKLLLGFMMTIRLKQIDREEYNFFLKGGKELNVDRKNQPMNPNQWIQPSNWNMICDLQKLPNFPNIVGAFIHNAKQWKKWYMSANPQKEPLPGQWNQKCDSMRKLIITKIIRRDRVLPAVINFIVDKNGNQTFVHPPNPSLQSVYGDSNKNTPIIFILSPGVDPYTQLQAFAKLKGVELVPVSLGQGQAKKAKDKVNQGARNGSWLYLANCHLSLGFLKDLEKMLETFQMNKNDVDDKFRLWLSTNPHPKFPISILQRCVKITTEPPKGIKANMYRLYSNMSKELYTSPNQANRAPYRRILYSLCWYHSLIIERKRFKTLGWNIIYDFNDSDWETAEKILQLYMEYTQEVKPAQSSITGDQPQVQKMPPWDAIRYLISQVTYGGRVTDDWDRRLLNVYATEYFNQLVISEEKHRIGNSNSAEYIIPEEQPQKQRNHETQPKYYLRKIEQLPTTEKPEVFGQHINAQISSQIADTNVLIESLQSLQAFSALTGDSSAQEKVKEIITELLSKVDEPFNEEQVYQKVKPQDQNPLKIVLIQEISRYNKLLKMVRKNLQDLQKGINGLVLISEELQKVMLSLFENKVPDKWKFAYYSLKPLSLWMLDLNKRVDQLRNWVHKGQPNVFWISGFSFPTGFTTALQQQASRKSNVPIDQFVWQFSFEKFDSSIMAPAKQGAYISGLFLEGAKWDGDKNCITQPEPMKLFYRMPIIQFKPTFVEGKQKAKKGQNLYTCPTYMYPIRTGVVQRKSFMFTVMLPIKPGVNTTTSSDQDFWAKRGAALLMSLAGQQL